MKTHKEQAEKRAREIYGWNDEATLSYSIARLREIYIKGYLDSIEQEGVEEAKRYQICEDVAKIIAPERCRNIFMKNNFKSYEESMNAAWMDGFQHNAKHIAKLREVLNKVEVTLSRHLHVDAGTDLHNEIVNTLNQSQ